MKSIKELKEEIYEDLKYVEHFYDIRLSETLDEKASYVYDDILNQLFHISEIECESEDYTYVTLLNL